MNFLKTVGLALCFLVMPLSVKAKDLSGMKKTKVYIIHGYMANPSNHWFPWLKKKLNDENIETKILDLPDSQNPKLEQWVSVLKKEIHNPDPNTFLVAHSLGCITTLKYLSEMPSTLRIGGLVCVSGFSESLPNLPMLNEFTKKKYDIIRVKEISPKSVVIVSEDDKIVSPDLTKGLSKELGSNLISLKKGGHFLDTDGFKEFPEVLGEIDKMISGGKKL